MRSQAILRLVLVVCLAMAPIAGGCGAKRGPEPGPGVEQGELRVMISGGLTAAYLGLIPALQRATGRTLVTSFGASMGTAPDAIPVRLARGERADVLIMVGYALADLVDQGKVVASSRVDLAESRIGVAVRAGAPRPDIGSVEALKRALLEAESIAYSASASGRYVSGELFPRLGITEQVKDKSEMILSERVGSVVARGDAEIGFQQISELLPIEGIDFLGPLPPEVQKVTVFSGGITVDAEDPAAAAALLRFLSSPPGSEAIEKSGLTPLGRAGSQSGEG